MKFKYILQIFALFTMLCGAYRMEAKVRVYSFEPDTVHVLKNPLTGWVMYLGRTWDENFWAKEGYDVMPVGEGKTVKVSDYASTCYLRTSWSSLEPEEGKYQWLDKDSRISKLFQSVRKRKLRLAFRIVVDSRDQGQNTPIYVKEAGAKGFQDPNNPKIWSPYPDDPVFQEKYGKFIQAFADYFDNPDVVDFIDAYGLGKWGESHAVRYQDYNNKQQVFNWITDLYSRTFKKVPILINYHRLVGDTLSWAAPNLHSKQMLEEAIAKGYSLRHDAFGMTGYYKDWEKEFAKEWFFRRPIIFEGGWITKAHHRYWIDPCGKYREGHSEDVRKGEYEIGEETHVNMMDLRINDETRSWFGKCFDLIKRFTQEGGYRLYPVKIVLPDKADKNGMVSIRHQWRNLGWGYCPTNIPQWNQKYKVCFSLSDQAGNRVKNFVVTDSDLSQWIKGKDGEYITSVSLLGIPKGTYTWQVALVDTTQRNEPGIIMAVDQNCQRNGWLRLGTIKIN